ncbi:hypothetical protein [Streptomyces sp. NPDC002962]|uniref:hypothetical protein n=1 Tax=Streptomyces sp. NPDC002962 TaxID=3364674 RepID=UPI00369E2DC1
MPGGRIHQPAAQDRPDGGSDGGRQHDKHSGFGRSTGPDYLEDWTQVKCAVINAA